ncbi:MAG: PilT/PilU family type 4a pilus ATPase [Candidatus Spechtbacteria bacterium SB0662_bin_43]|uniref:PilT/PilU family type 4a pilus ATPase n=1 Tax=Candidatus Spechtbacteria bacterium SB0662_bin_43 TaxID=2604897 RepID=A0A845DLF5_9BACT|nr:PilT/PilU family type 4a pilus ATPase [Candidatus Spechtbacteria bacterium SB0662_bin_43]
MSEYEQYLYGFIDMVIQQGASDLHLAAGRLPVLRIDGNLVRVTKSRILNPQDMENIVSVILDEKHREILEKNRAVDASFSYQDHARFRVNAYYQFNNLAVAMRYIPLSTSTVEELRLPSQVRVFTEYKQGLVLVVGPAGNGKSTTMSSLLEEINGHRQEHIITIEDPIEHVFMPKAAVIDQREIGQDTRGFAEALREVLRQDPDIIMVGEIRDAETVITAMTAAETGHLVFGTLSTNSAAQSINRIINLFPGDQQQQIRFNLALTLAGIISMRLLPCLQGGRLPATEILLANKAIRHMIRTNKIHEIDMVIETGIEEGMIPMNRSLVQLIRSGEVAADVAKQYVSDQVQFDALMKTL